MVRRYSIFQAVRSARVLGNIAADGACPLTRWIGCEEIATGFHPVAQLEVDDPRLDQRHPVFVVHIENRRHPRQGDHDSSVLCNRSAREPGPGATRHDGQIVRPCNPHHLSDLLGRLRKHNRGRFRGLDRRVDGTVVFIDEQVGRTAEDIPHAHSVFERCDK